MERGDSTSDISEATYLVTNMVASLERNGREAAIAATARHTGLSHWTVWGLLHNRRKAISTATLGAIRRAYLNLCERQIAHLKAEVNAIEDRCGEDADFTDLASEAVRLVARLKAARERAG